MKKYRIKKEAVPFILEKHATAIYQLDEWNELGIDIKALEEVEPAYITYGKKRDDTCSTLCGWSSNDGSDFGFTIHFPSMRHKEYDVFSKGRPIRELMDKIQSDVNRFYEQFNDDQI